MESLLEYSDLTTRASILKNRIEICEEQLEEILPLEQQKYYNHQQVYKYFFENDWETITKFREMTGIAIIVNLNYIELMSEHRHGYGYRYWFHKVGSAENPNTFWSFDYKSAILYITTIPTKFYTEYCTLLKLKEELYEIQTEIEERLKAIKTDKIDRPTKKPEDTKGEFGFVDYILLVWGIILLYTMGTILGGIIFG